jgi:hypothetical protein
LRFATGFRPNDEFSVRQYIAVDAAADTLTLYIDDSVAASGAATVTPATDNGPLWIGRSTVWDYGTMDGLVDDVRLYDVPHSAAEIAVIYAE